LLFDVVNGLLSLAYWQASQSGSSIEHAAGTGAGPPANSFDTELSVPVSMVDFSVPDAASERR
jgi:hypothetical protein